MIDRAEPAKEMANNRRTTADSIVIEKRVIVLLAIVWTIVLVATFQNLRSVFAASSPAVVSKVDPNTAPWWELTVLPRIGETVARRITTRREDANFHSVDDLKQVRGIGPKTVQRIARFVEFSVPLKPDQNAD